MEIAGAIHVIHSFIHPPPPTQVFCGWLAGQPPDEGATLSLRSTARPKKRIHHANHSRHSLVEIRNPNYKFSP
jgi:hypothetical protein